MIPHRLILEGFLSYRERQEIRFDGSSLWMLSGNNGSGKSSIFDAITFALFGYHRGGSAGAANLLHNGCREFAVSFEFTLQGTLHKIDRTFRVTKAGNATPKLALFRSIGPDLWEPIPGGTSAAGFREWIKDHLGFSYETFTASVLLLQGKSERLLDATNVERYDLLARIVDLERYQLLAGKAEDRRRKCHAERVRLETLLEAVPEIRASEIADANAKINAADTLRNEAVTQRTTLQNLLEAAKRWLDLTGRIRKLSAEVTAAEALLGDAAKIEAEHLRLTDLEAILPTLDGIRKAEDEIQAAQKRAEKADSEHKRLSAELRNVAQELERLRKTRGKIAGEIDEGQSLLTRIGERLNTLAGQLRTIEQFETQAKEVERFDKQLARMPVDASAKIAQQETELAEMKRRAKSLRTLEEYAAARSKQTKTKRLSTEAAQECDRIRIEGERLKQVSQERDEARKQAIEASRKAGEAVATAQALCDQAMLAVADVQHVGTTGVCRYCGQALTEGHRAKEMARRTTELGKAEQKLAAAKLAADQSQLAEQTTTAEAAKATEELQKLRERYSMAKQNTKQYDATAKEAADLATERYGQLPAEERHRLQLSAESEPTPELLEAERTASLGIEPLEAKLAELRRVDRERERLAAGREQAVVTFERLREALGGADPVSVRTENAKLTAEKTALGTQLAASRKALIETEKQIDTRQQDETSLRSRIGNHETTLNTERNSQAMHSDAIERSIGALPEIWRAIVRKAGLGQVHEWTEECRQLRSTDIRTRFTALAQAKLRVDGIKAERTVLTTQLEGIPVAAQRDPATLAPELGDAERNIRSAEGTYHAAIETVRALERDRAKREELRNDKLAADAEHARYVKLAELLGKNQLQRHLLRDAEGKIIEFANHFLDRLSEGQLFLRRVTPEEGKDEQHLALESVHRSVGSGAIGVAFLSGSQRFRVAVSLALAIGQYASKQHRPIESVIIDEGFGCLDRVGRQAMIRELRELKGLLKCIVLVSHQEEFADAFPDGYRFELAEGSTRVTRFRQ